MCHINANNSYNPPCKVITNSQCAISHNNDCTKIVNYEETINSGEFCYSNSELELEENESNLEYVDKNKIEFSHIKENNNVNTVVSKNRISTSELNMLPHGECEGNKPR